MTLRSNPALPLAGGFHAGPLFVPKIKRDPVCPKSKRGIMHGRHTRRRTPSWARNSPYKQQIAAFYAEARRLTKLTGILHVVDHIVPKCGKRVTGLHVPWNLRVITWYENTRKGNWVWPNMWQEQMELF